MAHDEEDLEQFGTSPGEDALLLAQARLASGDVAAARSLATRLAREVPEAALGVLLCDLVEGLDSHLEIDLEQAEADRALRRWVGVVHAGGNAEVLESIRRAAPAVAEIFPWLAGSLSVTPATAARERYAVTVISPPGYPHAAAFHEIAETLGYALRALGHDVVVGTDPALARRRHIVLGANLLPHTGARLQKGSIVYNLEQVQAGSPWLTPELLDVYRRSSLWDYSAANAEALVAMGLPRPAVVPIGWMPQLTRIEKRQEDIDVLFYGSVNDRRRTIIEGLRARGTRVHAAFGVYGEERDRLIARSRIVLNVHYYEAKVFEIVRVSYLLGNGRVVVSERGCSPAEEAPFENAVAFAQYDGLVERCLALLGDVGERRRLAGAGATLMSSRLQTEYLRDVVAASERA